LVVDRDVSTLHALHRCTRIHGVSSVQGSGFPERQHGPPLASSRK
jgi:hypothetical protein